MFRPTALLFAIAITMHVSLVHAADEDAAPQQIEAFRRLDQNQDGVISQNELPSAVQANFHRVDLDGNGRISLAEHIRFLNRKAARQPRSDHSDWRIHRNIAYVPNGHPRQTLDIYQAPPFVQHAPLVIWIHGGGWRAGSAVPCPITALAERGFVIASINYRLSQHAVFPAQIHDCRSAVRWLRSNSLKYGIDPDRIGVWGASAGGHLAALLGTSAAATELNATDTTDRTSCVVQAVCDWFGPTDLLKLNQHAGNLGTLDHDAAESPESLLLGGPLQQNQELAHLASPLTWIKADAPPFLIVHGEEDPLVSIRQSELLHEALRKAGGSSEFVRVPDAGHGQFSDPAVKERCFEFFSRTLTSKPSPASQ